MNFREAATTDLSNQKLLVIVWKPGHQMPETCRQCGAADCSRMGIPVRAASLKPSVQLPYQATRSSAITLPVTAIDNITTIVARLLIIVLSLHPPDASLARRRTLSQVGLWPLKPEIGACCPRPTRRRNTHRRNRHVV